EPEEEPAKAAECDGDRGERRRVVAPRSRNKVLNQARYDNVVTLEPHADVDQETDDERRRDMVAHTLRPEEKRENTVTKSHDPEIRRVRTDSSLFKQCPLVRVARIPSHEEFEGV